MSALTKVILFTAYIFIYLPNIYSQTLTAEQIYKKVSGAVVVIHAYDYNEELASQGSGVIINDEGYLVTNYHLLKGNERVEVLHNKKIIQYSDIIGIDVERDILILKIESGKIPAIKIGDSKTINIGEKVYAIGSPLGFENTISEGIISGLRNYDEFGGKFIQITASISHGSSGGAVVNDKGELIGISTLTAMEGQNLNFAIPIDDVLDVEIRSYANDHSYKDYELFSKGLDARKRGNNQEAIEYYSLFIIKYPNFPGAYNNRGLAKLALDDFRGAIQDCNKVIEIEPNYLNIYNARGSAKRKLKEYQEAIKDYNKAIKIEPYNADAYYNRGLAKLALDDFRGAIQDCNKVIEIEPYSADAYNIRGIAKLYLRDNYGGCLDLSKAGELGYDKAYDTIRNLCN